MYSKNQLDRMSAEIGRARRNYHRAVAANLKETGVPVKVQGDNEEIDGIELAVEEDGRLCYYIFDMVGWDGDRNDVMVHYTSYGFTGVMGWMHLSELGDAEDFLLEAVQWLEEGESTKDAARSSFVVITLDREDLREYLDVQRPEEVDDAVMERIADGMGEWLLGDFPQALRACAEEQGISGMNGG